MTSSRALPAGRRIIAGPVRWSAVIVLVAGLLPLLTAAPAEASSCTGNAFVWTGNGDGSSWSDSHNWDPDLGTPPSSDDEATISADASGWTINGAQSVCDLTVSATSTNSILLDATPGITIGHDFTVTGPDPSAKGVSMELNGNFTVNGTTTFSGAVDFDASDFGTGDGNIDVHTQSLTVEPGANVELASSGSKIQVDGSALIGNSTIWSNQSGGNDAVAKLILGGTTLLAGDVDALLDVNLPSGAVLDLAGSTLTAESHSNSRWSSSATVESSGSSGTVTFGSGGVLLLDGAVTLDSGVTLQMTPGSTLSDGTLFPNGGLVGGPGELGGDGVLEWSGGGEVGSVTLDAGFHAAVVGGATASVGMDPAGDAAAGELVNHGDLTVAGELHLNDSGQQLVNDGTVAVQAGGVISGGGSEPTVVNEPAGTLAASPGLAGNGTATVSGAAVLDQGQLGATTGNLLVLTGASSSVLEDGSVVSGGGTTQVGDAETVQLLGTVAVDGGSTFALDGAGAALHAGQSGTAAVLDAHTAQGGGRFEWDTGTVYGQLLTDHDLQTVIQNSTQDSYHDVADPGLAASQVTLGSPTSLTGTIAFSSSGDVLALDAPLTATGTAQIGTSTSPGAGAVFVVDPSGTFTVSGSGTDAVVDYPMSNLGTFDVAGGGVDLQDGYTQTGSSAVTELAGGATVSTLNGTGNGYGTVTLDGGEFLGAGTVLGDLHNAGGTVQPGVDAADLGTLTVQGAYTQGTAGRLTLHVDGAAAGQHDELAASGAATISGELHVLTGSPAPPYGATVPALTAASVSGTFGSLTSDLVSSTDRWKQQAQPGEIDLVMSDIAKPTAHLTAPSAPFTRSTSQQLTWTGSDTGGSGIAGYDLRWRVAGYSGSFGAWTTPSGWSHLTATSKTVTGLVPGRDYCFSVRASDKAGNVGAWSAARCTSPLLDDRALSASAGWSRATATGYYHRTFSRSSTQGAGLALSGVQADRVAVVVDECATCGTLDVKLGSTLLARVNLHAATTHRSRLILLPVFRLRSGTLHLLVHSSAKPVIIDAVGLSRS